jgi:hypothetical protein
MIGAQDKKLDRITNGKGAIGPAGRASCETVRRVAAARMRQNMKIATSLARVYACVRARACIIDILKIDLKDSNHYWMSDLRSDILGYIQVRCTASLYISKNLNISQLMCFSDIDINTRARAHVRTHARARGKIALASWKSFRYMLGYDLDREHRFENSDGRPAT